MCQQGLSRSLNPIGIFDSGVGGLTVVREVFGELPGEEIIYFGDTARVPYGAKTKETVTRYSKQIVEFLLTKNIKAVIIACGTVSSNSYEELTKTFDIPIFEMVTNGVNACLSVTKNNRVGVIATEATIRSGRYEALLKQKRLGIEVYSKACPLFAPLVEEGWVDNEIAKMTAGVYLKELAEKDIDALVLGCTHYPLLTDCIKGVMGGIHIINPAEQAAKSVNRFLTENNLKRTSQTPPVHKFYISDNTEKFNRLCRHILGKDYEAQLIGLDVL